MGCWSETCMLTNLPIRYGEEVYGFIIGNCPAMHTSYCSPADIWRPLGFFFEGEYDDYGRIHNIKNTKMMDYNIQFIKKYLIEVPAENKYCNSLLKETFDLTSFWKGEHDDKLSIAHITKQYVFGLKVVMIKKSALDNLMKEWDSYEFYNREISKTETISLTDHIKSVIAELKKILETPDPENKYMAKHNFGNLVERGIFRDYFYYNFWGVKDLFEKAIEEKDDVLYNELVQQYLVFGKLSDFLDHSRKIWSPQSGSGSQDDGMEAQKTLAEITLKLVDEQKKKDIEEYDED